VRPSFDADIDLFAELSARLDDPFAEHVEVLLGAGLDQAALMDLQDRWKTRLQQASDEAMHLTQRFAAAYARTQQVLEEARRDARQGGTKRAPDPRFLSAQVQTWREEAAAVALSVSADTSLPARGTASPAPVRRAPPPPANAAPEPRSTPDWVPIGMRRFVQLGVTQDADDSPGSAGIPFDPSAEPQLPDRPEASAWMPKGMLGFSTSGGTQDSSEAPVGPALPFAPPAPPQGPAPTIPALTLEQYASLCVELDAEQCNRLEILRKYRLSEEQTRKLQVHWRAKFVVEPKLKAQWQQACTAYEAWLLRARPKQR
jgi:hypothetical protein